MTALLVRWGAWLLAFATVPPTVVVFAWAVCQWNEGRRLRASLVVVGIAAWWIGALWLLHAAPHLFHKHHRALPTIISSGVS